ncbi:hypothetical protein K8I61_17620 [bacterium]|nr:hypothetical protein [bacterium]
MKDANRKAGRAAAVAKTRLAHVGSTKNLRVKKAPTATRPGVMWFEFTDDYSVFDHGKMPDAIPNKGAAAAMLSAHLFEEIARPATWKAFAKNGVLDKVRDKALRDEIAASPVYKRLAREGFPTHYRGIVDDSGEVVPLAKLRGSSNVLEVQAVRIVRPETVTVSGRRLYNYGAFRPDLKNHLVPLECVFRFGAPKGSSLIRRVAENPGYARELGLTKPVKEGARLPRPVIELFSKLEPADRFLAYESAMNFAGLSPDAFVTLLHATLLVALWLSDQFAEAGLTLWDGKFEFVRLGSGLALADAITPDELRLTYKSLQISKEPLRQYHIKRQPEFIDAMNKAKKIAERDDRPLHEIVASLGGAPTPVDADMLAAISHMYAGITERVLGREIFGGVAQLPEIAKRLRRWGVA